MTKFKTFEGFCKNICKDILLKNGLRVPKNFKLKQLRIYIDPTKEIIGKPKKLKGKLKTVIKNENRTS